MGRGCLLAAQAGSVVCKRSVICSSPQATLLLTSLRRHSRPCPAVTRLAQATTLPAGPADRPALQALARWVPAFPAIFFAFLSSQPALYEACAGQLAPAELAALRAAKQPSPLLALATMSCLVQRWEGGWAGHHRLQSSHEGAASTHYASGAA